MRHRIAVWILGLAIGFATLSINGSQGAWAQANLEDPQPGSFQSGIGLIRGWVCAAPQVEIEIDGQFRFAAAYGTTRGDTKGVCVDVANGFGLSVNWNLLGTGSHRMRALADGQPFADVTFTVTTLGGKYLWGLSGGCTVPNFPQAGHTTTLAWQESI